MTASGPYQPVGHLAATHPVAVRVFHRHDIDIGWEGREPLARACARRGLDPARVLREIATEEARGGTTYVRWEARPLGELVDHIVLRYHQPLRQQLPELERLTERVLRLYPVDARERLGGVLATLGSLRRGLLPHLAKEEVVLFPWLRSGRGSSAAELLHASADEHGLVGEGLARLRVLTDNYDYQVPPASCAAWNELWVGLQLLEGDLREHIHLENDILFPRALAC